MLSKLLLIAFFLSLANTGTIGHAEPVREPISSDDKLFSDADLAKLPPEKQRRVREIEERLNPQRDPYDNYENQSGFSNSAAQRSIIVPTPYGSYKDHEIGTGMRKGR